MSDQSERVDPGEPIDPTLALRVWAQLARDTQAPQLSVALAEDICWMGTDLNPAEVVGDSPTRGTTAIPSHVSERAGFQRLTRIDALNPAEPLLALGWVLLAGTLDRGDGPQKVLLPLVSRPVHVQRQSLARRAAGRSLDLVLDSEYSFDAIGDLEASHLIEDPSARGRAADRVQVGGGALTSGVYEEHKDALLARLARLRSWISETTKAMGLPVTRMTTELHSITSAENRDGLTAYVGLTRSPLQASVRSSLLSWAGQSDLQSTALAAVLGRRPSKAANKASATPIRSPLPISAPQREVVLSTRSAPVTVLSGAPGTGKTHTLCAAAMDTIAAAESVLIATRSRAAADSVCALLTRMRGPDPIRFGDGHAIASVINELSHRRLTPLSTDEVDRLERAMSDAEQREGMIRRAVLSAIDLEARSEAAQRSQLLLPRIGAEFPALVDPSTDLAAIETLLVKARNEGAEPSGPLRRWWDRRKRARAASEARRIAGARGEDDLGVLAAALEVALDCRASATLAASGGTALTEMMHQLQDAANRRRECTGERLAAIQSDPDRLSQGGSRAITGLLSALRAGRGRRRELLTGLPTKDLTAATPLWVGTLSDIEDVLPPSAAMFDLVILDEASQIDQPSAAGALARAGRALIVGDPRQLGLTSFVSDSDIDAAIDLHFDPNSTNATRRLLDVRRVSAFDLAAGTGSVVRLSEHYRSDPHLIAFPLREFYGEEVAIMTTRPDSESADRIETIRIASPLPSGADAPDAESIRRAEAELAVDIVERLISTGERDVGIITPFRQHAQVIEALLTQRFSLEQILDSRLAVGTVHSFQGAERDTMIISPGLTPLDPAGRKRFADNPNLFNVMVSRARRNAIVLDSGTEVGLLTRYIEHAQRGPIPLPDIAPPDRWTRSLASGLRSAGHSVRTGYRFGPHRLDLVVEAQPPIAIETTVDPGGSAAHLDRRETLGSLGWRVIDAFASHFDDDSARAVVQLSDELEAELI